MMTLQTNRQFCEAFFNWNCLKIQLFETTVFIWRTKTQVFKYDRTTTTCTLAISSLPCGLSLCMEQARRALHNVLVSSLSSGWKWYFKEALVLPKHFYALSLVWKYTVITTCSCKPWVSRVFAVAAKYRTISILLTALNEFIIERRKYEKCLHFHEVQKKVSTSPFVPPRFLLVNLQAFTDFL